MKPIPVEVRERVVEAYRKGLTGTYRSTAQVFSISEATVSRILGKARHGKSLEPRFTTGRKRCIDVDWLRAHATEHEDARIVDRVDAWLEQSGRKVSSSAMWSTLRLIGWTHKKRRR
jgi:transposase